MTSKDPYGIDIDLKVYRYLKNVVDTVELKGIKKGLEQGRQQGHKEGILDEKRKNAKAMKDLGLPLETIAKVTGMSVAEIEEL